MLLSEERKCKKKLCLCRARVQTSQDFVSFRMRNDSRDELERLSFREVLMSPTSRRNLQDEEL